MAQHNAGACSSVDWRPLGLHKEKINVRTVLGRQVVEQHGVASWTLMGDIAVVFYVVILYPHDVINYARDKSMQLISTRK